MIYILDKEQKLKDKIKSGSQRDKSGPTPKQNKWKNGFYARARCKTYSSYDKWLLMKNKKSPF